MKCPRCEDGTELEREDDCEVVARGEIPMAWYWCDGCHYTMKWVRGRKMHVYYDPRVDNRIEATYD